MIVLSAAIGGGLELFDFVIYLFLSPIISALFFPQTNERIAFLITLGGFAAGYFARPLGGIIYGHFGDRIGRRRSLAFSLFGMAIPTFLISLLPPYSRMGLVAPFLLILFRFSQGLAMGGDVPGAMCFIGEHIPLARRGFMTSCLLFGMNMGAVCASLLVAALISLLPHATMLQWGWRIPFLLGALLAIVGFYVRQYTSETPEFRKYHSLGQLEAWPLKTLLRDHSRSILLGFSIAGLAAALTSMMSLFMATYLSRYLGMNPKLALWLNSTSICAYSFCCLLMGNLIDRWKASRTLLHGAMAIFFLAYPIYRLISSHHLPFVMLGLLLSAPLLASIMCSIPTLLIELFPTPIRYSGIGVSYNFGFSLFAGISPLLLAYSISVTHFILMPAFLIMIFVIFALPAILSLRALRAF